MEKVSFKQAQPGLRISTLDQAQEFYTALGFQALFRNGNVHLVIGKDDVVLHLSTVEGGAGSCQILVENIDELYKYVMDKEISVLYEIGDREWGNRDFTITDPDGNRITFSQSLETD